MSDIWKPPGLASRWLEVQGGTGSKDRPQGMACLLHKDGESQFVSSRITLDTDSTFPAKSSRSLSPSDLCKSHNIPVR